MSSTRGFTNIPIIRKALNELYREFGSRHLNSYPESFTLGTLANDLRSDAVIGTQHLAKRIAAHYRLPLTRVIVIFSSVPKIPGRVELSSSNEFFVELHSQHRSEPKAIAAILAHEVAHIFLHKCGVRFADEFANEVLTDTTAAYLGFGPTILNAVTENKRYLPGNVVETRTHHFGYLTLTEFGYIVAKRDRLYRTDSAASIEPGTPRDAFRSGRSYLQCELRRRPFSSRPWYQRIFSRPLSNGRFETALNKSITFFCTCCSQGLRIPGTRQKLSVRCSNCDTRFICYS